MKKRTGSKRPTWDEYFLKFAEIVGSRSTCDRAHVGAVITKGKVILSTGYNGAPRGLPHCDDVGHEIVDGHCISGPFTPKPTLSPRPPATGHPSKEPQYI